MDVNTAPNLDLPNDDIYIAYEFFLYDYLHPYDIAVDLFDVPDVIKNPYDKYEFKRAIKNNLMTMKNLEDYAVVDMLNDHYAKYAKERKIPKTNITEAIQHYSVPDKVIEKFTEGFLQDLKEFNTPKITELLCAYLLNLNLSKQAYLDTNYLASNILYHNAFECLIQLKIMLGKNLTINTNKVLKNIAAKNGRKGGTSKSNNTSEARQLIFQKHDEKYAEIRENGKHFFSNTKAAEKIKQDLIAEGKKVVEIYSENTMRNLISEYRKERKKIK